MSTQKTQPDSESLTAKPALLASTISYQDGAIVSRTFTDKKTGTITLFAFDREQGLSEHTAPYDAFVLLVEGIMKITIAGKEHRIEKDQFLIMPANRPHALSALEKSKMLLVMIREQQTETDSPRIARKN